MFNRFRPRYNTDFPGGDAVDDSTIRILSGTVAVICFLLLLRRRAKRKSGKPPES